ncbi:orotidine-5'-phosphate decarboxylase [Lachnospiraceae bacterium oral taxon 500]|nr:orotidine-5'-phosphate decarboxylase [Lachnospiraceae bacterium oral taxon 500]
MNQINAKDVIVALDFPSAQQALAFTEKFDQPIFVKIGMELFYAAGPSIVETIKQQGHKVFLDLKFHDIPNTVAGATKSCLNLGADIMNLHAGGGSKMMQAAAEAVKEYPAANKPLLIAVTQLTSTSADMLREELLITAKMEDTVLAYAQNAKNSGLDGVVCSALEVRRIKDSLGEDFITVTPGIRPADAEVGDQARVVTPQMARELGSDYIVVGRPITKAADPVAAYRQIKKDFLGE